MHQSLAKNKIIFFLYLLFLASATTFVCIEGKTESELMINRMHSAFFDTFFRIMTFFGDGMFIVLAGLLLMLFVRIRYGVIILSSFVVSSLTVQLLKRLIFFSWDRPVLYFQKLGIEFYQIQGLQYLRHFSFPSGHTTSAFMFFTGMALFTERKSLKALFMVMAFIVSFSRVYLFQHFIVDIIAGSLLGVATILIFYILFIDIDKPYMDKRILKFRKQKND
jgi:membrane-associated phospholipid phosphatase